MRKSDAFSLAVQKTQTDSPNDTDESPLAPGPPRMLRVEYPGAIYRVMNRGDRREPTSRDDMNRKLFLGTLGERCGKMRAWTNMSKLLSWQRRKGK